MRWVILLRGVNVGGAGRLPMAGLRAAMEARGAENVASYIQSGNLLCDLPESDPRAVESRVAEVIEAGFGFRPGVMAFAPAALDDALAHLPQGAAEPSRMHLAFFTGAPRPDALDVLRPACTQGEVPTMGEHCLYLHAPQGLGRSKVTGRIEKALGCPATVRNLNTVRKIRDLV